MTSSEKMESYRKKLEMLSPYLTKGALITHNRCCNAIEEHYFTGYDGLWICGKATKETVKFGGFKSVNDVSVNNITHINRVPVEDYLAGYPDLSETN